MWAQLPNNPINEMTLYGAMAGILRVFPVWRERERRVPYVLIIKHFERAYGAFWFSSEAKY